jgi:hypothetical protein
MHFRKLGAFDADVGTVGDIDSLKNAVCLSTVNNLDLGDEVEPWHSSTLDHVGTGLDAGAETGCSFVGTCADTACTFVLGQHKPNMGHSGGQYRRSVMHVVVRWV